MVALNGRLAIQYVCVTRRHKYKNQIEGQNEYRFELRKKLM